MRRQDREIVDHQTILEILNRCDVIRLGINAPDYPYVVPLNFGMETESGLLTLWFHCAAEGLKLDLIKANPCVGFEADCSHKLIVGETACHYTMAYESVMGYGRISICHDSDGKRQGLTAIMAHYAPGKNFDFSDEALAHICVLRLAVLHMTGKKLQPDRR